MEACQKRIQEVESSLQSFIESISERLIKTDDKIEAICNRIERLESLSSNNTRDLTEIAITTDSVDENELSKKQMVKYNLFQWLGYYCLQQIASSRGKSFFSKAKKSQLQKISDCLYQRQNLTRDKKCLQLNYKKNSWLRTRSSDLQLDKTHSLNTLLY